MDFSNEPIDIVFLWVDGSDPEHRKRRFAAMGKDQKELADEIGGETRYSNLGELGWSVASVNRYMPWVRKIYIVTDRQDPLPQLEFTRQHFDNPIPVEVVDHTDIFGEDADLLPVFNSISIESMIWRIKGLSRFFIYFNDDMFVLNPMRRDEWLTDDGRMIIHGHNIPLWFAKLGDRLRRDKQGHHVMGFKTAMIAAAELLGAKKIPYYYHTPVLLDRELLEKYFAEHPEPLRRNSLHKFRAPEQFSVQILNNILADREGRLIQDRVNNNLFLKPTSDRPDYLTERLPRADTNPALRLGCISSLDRASDLQRAQFRSWIESRLS